MTTQTANGTKPEVTKEVHWYWCMPCAAVWSTDGRRMGIYDLFEQIREPDGFWPRDFPLPVADCGHGHKRSGGLVNAAFCPVCRKMLELYEEPGGGHSLPMHSIGGQKCEGSLRPSEVTMRPARYGFEYETKPQTDREAEELWTATAAASTDTPEEA